VGKFKAGGKFAAREAAERESSVMDDWKKISVARWVSEAKNDLEAAKTLLRENPDITDVLCFHAHNAQKKLSRDF
jgi:dephospho-CoA kinase